MSLYDSLNPQQHAAIEALYGPILVLAGAGSGKTRVVTYRIAHLLESGVDPSAILGVTFTNKAAEEMKERVQKLTHYQVLICTFHSLGAKILRESIYALGYGRNFTIYDEQDSEKLVKLCINELAHQQKLDAQHFISLISSAKNALQDPDQINPASLDELEKLFPDVYRLYQAKLKECNAVDFDDLLYLPVKLFKTYPDILDHYQKRWSFLLIDEFQDTNQAQYLLVQHLGSQHQNVCVVGDPDQSIYSWRGANIQNILGFESDFPGAKIIRLEQNYRSRANILEASNALINNNRSRYEKNLWSDRGAGEKIKHFTADTERGEADFVAEKIRYHYENHHISLRQMAVFYRTNAQSRALEDKLLLHHVPYVIVGGISFYQRREIKDILAFLRMVQSGMDFISFSRTINIPKRGIGETTIERIRLSAAQEGLSLMGYSTKLIEDTPLQYAVKLSAKQKEGLKSYVQIIHELKEISKACDIQEVVKAAIERSGYLEYLKGEMESYQERKENLNALVSKAIEWELSAMTPSLEGFLEELSLKSTLDETNSSYDKVHLMTVHNAKGLEFDVAFLAGMEEDLFPHANSRGSLEALEEERRLCYVGMTRAKEYLYLCDVRQRFLWGTTRIQRPSRFLREIPEEYIERIRPSFMSKTQFTWRPSQVETQEVTFIDEIDQTIPEEENEEPLDEGDAIFHKDFGVGVIRQIYEGSAGLTYKVLFSKDNRERSLVARLAHLKKLS